ncbi:MAG: RIP metalloprotease RseP [Steroidobacteraceae bacterium]
MNLSWQHLLAFLFAVGLLVTVHEFGHYWVARRLGFKVLRFSVGFGKSLWSRTAGKDGTEYVLAAIPLGGYVKLLDEREAPVEAHELHRAFNRRPHWQRILVLLAGPAFNFAFAILLLAVLFWWKGVTEVRPVVGDVLPDSPAARAGLARGDEVLAFNGEPVAGKGDVVLGLLEQMTLDGHVEMLLQSENGAQRTAIMSVPDSAERRRLTEPENLLRGLGFDFWAPVTPAIVGKLVPGAGAERAGLAVGDVIAALNGTPVSSFEDLSRRIEEQEGNSVLLGIRRAGQELSLRVEVAVEKINGRRVGRLGIYSQSTSLPESMVRHSKLGPAQSLVAGANEAWRMTSLQAIVFWRMLRGNVSLKNLSGPLGIAEAAGNSAQSGVAAFVSFLALISLSLGFLNLLPVPILDGGQIVYQLVEWIKGSPLSERAQVVGQQLGIGVLVLLMGLALFNDILRQFG